MEEKGQATEKKPHIGLGKPTARQLLGQIGRKANGNDHQQGAESPPSNAAPEGVGAQAIEGTNAEKIEIGAQWPAPKGVEGSVQNAF